MRASLKGKEDLIVAGKKYRGLPLELHPYYVYLQDLGHCILCVPQRFWATDNKDFAKFEIPIPITYVINHIYAVKDGYVFVDVPCDDNGHPHLRASDFAF